MLFVRLILACALVVAALVPAWWHVQGLGQRTTSPFFRLLQAAGLALVTYLSMVNLLGRLLRQSTLPATLAIGLAVFAAIWLWRLKRDDLDFGSLWRTRGEWGGIVLAAVAIGLPQIVLAISTPFWDEVASSAIHLTAANQFAEGVFPPRHNALPDIVTKYHYGFAILSGSVHWITGLSVNVSIDVVSTALWLFTFLFLVCWLRELGMGRAATLWGACATLVGGGLAWLFVRRVEAYSGFEVSPPPSELIHKYSDALSLWDNLLGSVKAPSVHLRNPDGTLSNLPWDIVAQFQQHAVSLGIALAVFALYVFVQWRRSADQRDRLGVLTILTFGLLFLAHAVFGGVAAVSAGLILLGSWLRAPTKRGFIEGIAFGVGVGVVAVLHGGFLAFGKEYGASGDVLTLRHAFGYSRGGATGFFLWNIAGFGLPLVLAIVAWITWPMSRLKRDATTRLTFTVLTVFALFSYLVPQVAFYSSETIGVEEFTEISKFFFTAHLGFALISAFGIQQWSSLGRRAAVPLAAAMMVTPLLFAFVGSTRTTPAGIQWAGLYHAPYFTGSVEQQMGERLKALKRSNHETYFDASADERTHGYLSELLVYGGSIFTLTPSRYERTGIGYRLSQDVVAARLIQNGRMAQLRPGAAEACDCRWYYARPTQDMAFVPPFVRARFDKLVAERAFVSKLTGADRELFAIEKPTAAVDRGIELYWRPRVVMQTNSDVDGDGRADLVFYDYANNQVIIGDKTIAAPIWMAGELGQLWVGRINGGRQSTLLFGRATDTDFRLGRSINDIVERNDWGWTQSRTDGGWSTETPLWAWNGEIPIIAPATAGRGLQSLIVYRASDSHWIAAASATISGPALGARDLPIPFAGRFIKGSDADLGVRSRSNGRIAIQSRSSDKRLDFTWGLGPNEVLVNGDYDGDGYDEIGIYNEQNFFWYRRTAPDGPITQFQFGKQGAVPIPFDYNHDGRLDAAYWMPAEQKIYVTFSNGRAVDRVVAVPAHSFPAFVNVY